MAVKKPTRERILDAALTLFNEHRFAKVTTAQVAKACGIAEGNLWYHFNDREALLEGLLERFSNQVENRLAITPSKNDILEDYAAFYLMMADELSSYRFFYRDQRDYEALIGKLSDRFPDLYSRTAKQFRTFLTALSDDGHVDFSEQKIASITTVSLMIFRYASEFTREANIPLGQGADLVHYAFRLHMTLYEDSLTPAAKDILTRRFCLEPMSEYLL
ncbi:MAG: TetR/AcrR family transcriptional regulator [Pseudomonadota bacterium]